MQAPPPKTKRSFDFLLSIAFHIVAMIVLFAHFSLGIGIQVEIELLSAVAVVCVILSLRNRKKLDWRWPGTKPRNVFQALIGAAFIIFFLGAILPGKRILDPAIFPWLAAGANFLVFAVLSELKVVNQNNAAFLRDCSGNLSAEPPPPPTLPQLPRWKRAIVIVFGYYFIAVWVLGVSFFWKFNSAMSHGSSQPTVTQTERLTDHGHSVYITPEEKHIVHLLEYSLTFGIPSVFVLSAVLHFGLGIPVFGKKTFPRPN